MTQKLATLNIELSRLHIRLIELEWYQSPVRQYAVTPSTAAGLHVRPTKQHLGRR
jgi:hypothetical protein